MTSGDQDILQRIAALEAEVARLRQSTVFNAERGTTLVAPGKIVDGNGRLLAEVRHSANDVAVEVFNDEGRAVATLGADGTQAGYLAVRNAEGRLVAYLDVETAGARLQLLDHRGRGGVVVFGGDSGEDRGGGINVIATSGNLSASVWSGKQWGELALYDVASEDEVTTLPAAEQPGAGEGT